jgi:hypothetical protein
MLPVDASANMPPFKPHWDLFPRVYVAPKSPFPLLDHLDGDLNKDVWSKVPWSDEFDDIRGKVDAPEGERPRPSCRTRFKALWDDTHLYIGALLESDFETQAHFTERNSPIYQKDSDFEVFIDPMGSCQSYKELEVNAINTIWNLMLDRPYSDGGVEHSGRIAKPGDDLFYEVYKQKTAVRVVKGKLNDPNGSATWSVEVALSYDDLLANVTDSAGLPGLGSMWRINFSRVEKNGDINWTWQPQIVWDPERRQHSGYVDMHRPDAWGYVVFGGKLDETRSVDASDPSFQPRDPSWPARLAAMNVYYAQHIYHKINDSFASSLAQLRDLIDPSILTPFEIEIILPSDGSTNNEFVTIVRGNPDGCVVTVTHDRYLRVESISSEVS